MPDTPRKPSPPRRLILGHAEHLARPLAPGETIEIVNKTEATYTLWCGRGELAETRGWREERSESGSPVEITSIVLTRDDRVLGLRTDDEARDWLVEHVDEFSMAWTAGYWCRTAREAIDQINRAEGETP